ncbi:hypothetical protein ADK70_23475 [Streptomyces rimosus subsp. pseudoverticillatus]|nr:hypothetical protein ADK70_23475 [Streptomyces rimosus subsp. pseudoverticillatus]
MVVTLFARICTAVTPAATAALSSVGRQRFVAGSYSVMIVPAWSVGHSVYVVVWPALRSASAMVREWVVGITVSVVPCRRWMGAVGVRPFSRSVRGGVPVVRAGTS